MKHWRVRDVGLPSVTLGNVNHANRKFLFLHLPHLTIGRMWGKNDLTLSPDRVRPCQTNKKRLPLVPCRMVGGHVQRFKCVPIPVYLWVSDTRKSDAFKNSCYLGNRLRATMQMTFRWSTSRGRHINPILLK